MLAAAPKIISEIDLSPVKALHPNAALFNDLNFVIPDYIPSLMAKYGNDNYALVMELIGKESPRHQKFFWYETNESES